MRAAGARSNVAWRKLDAEAKEIHERLVQVGSLHVADPNLLPPGVDGLDRHQVRRQQWRLLLDQSGGQTRTRLIREPLHGDGRVDDHRRVDSAPLANGGRSAGGPAIPHRVRSCRTSSTARERFGR
jgi:hypothetical protein